MQRQLAERELTSEGPTRRAAQRGGRSVTVNLAEFAADLAACARSPV